MIMEFEKHHYPEDSWDQDLEETYWWGFDDGYMTAWDDAYYMDEGSSDDDWWFDEETGDWWYFDYESGEWLMEDNSWEDGFAMADWP